MVISCSPLTFQGLEAAAVVQLGASHKRRSLFYSMGEASEDTGDEGDAADQEYLRQLEKKRRLSADQVKALEKNFEVENKLEPERKVQLARELGLQPRQVAVWFQNRRARWKSKQLEKDYDILKADYDALKREYEIALKEKEKLQAQALCLSEKLRPPDGEKPRRGSAPSISESRESNCAKSSIHLTVDQVSNEGTTGSLDPNPDNHLVINLRAAAGKEAGSTSLDSDDTSEVLDVESPLIQLQLKHFPTCFDLPTLVSCADPPSDLIQIGNGNHEKFTSNQTKSYLSIVKLEAHEQYPQENSNYFLNPEDQVTGLPWWEWS